MLSTPEAFPDAPLVVCLRRPSKYRANAALSAACEFTLRLILGCERPSLRREEGLAWLRAHLDRVTLDPEIRAASITELESPGPQLLHSPLLIEFELATKSNPDSVIKRAGVAQLVSDLRSLGLRPQVALAPAPVHIEVSK